MIVTFSYLYWSPFLCRSYSWFPSWLFVAGFQCTLKRKCWRVEAITVQYATVLLVIEETLFLLPFLSNPFPFPLFLPITFFPLSKQLKHIINKITHAPPSAHKWPTQNKCPQSHPKHRWILVRSSWFWPVPPLRCTSPLHKPLSQDWAWTVHGKWRMRMAALPYKETFPERSTRISCEQACSATLIIATMTSCLHLDVSSFPDSNGLDATHGPILALLLLITTSPAR